MFKRAIAISVILLTLLIDQASKIWVKLSMTLGEDIPYLGDWARIHFVENEGMAFGLSFGGGIGKFLLTLFRLVAVLFIIYYIRQQVRNPKATKGFIICLSLILTGAIGNIVDSLFYGLLFNESTMTQVATMFPAQGYASIFHGRVVDMFYFPIYRGYLPDWIPVIHGRYMEFFPYIFNFADACITVGVFLVLIFQHKFFKED